MFGNKMEREFLSILSDPARARYALGQKRNIPGMETQGPKNVKNPLLDQIPPRPALDFLLFPHYLCTHPLTPKNRNYAK